MADVITPDTSTEPLGRGADTPMSDDEAAASLNDLFKAEPKKKKIPPQGADGKFQKAKPEEAEPEAEPKAEAEPEAEPEPEEKPKPKAKAAEPEPDDEEEAPKPRTLKVKVDGMEVEIDEEEIKKGYSRTADYTRKTQQLAEERKKFEAEERAAVREERKYYAERLEMLEEALKVLGPQQEPDWNTLRTSLNSEEFTQAFSEWRTHQQRFEKARAERDAVREREEKDSTAQRQARLTREMEKLYEAIPDLRDAEKGKALRDDLTAYANSVGFSDDDLASVEDHRALVLLDKARRWDEYQKNKPKVQEKVDRAMANLKPQSSTPKPSARSTDALTAKFDSSRADKDAADLINHLLAPQKKAG